MCNILIIDDEKAIRKTLSEILSYEGYKIEEASDGEEGLKKFRDKTYDVVLCDIKMPKLDGLEFLDKARDTNPDVPVIMISGHGTIETAVEATKIGAQSFLEKPITMVKLLKAVEAGLSRTNGAGGARKPGSTMVTSALRGIFKDNASSRAEILALMHGDVGS